MKKKIMIDKAVLKIKILLNLDKVVLNCISKLTTYAIFFCELIHEIFHFIYN